MKNLNLQKAAFILLSFMLFSCNKTHDSKPSTLKNNSYSISLKDPIYLNNKLAYNLHWDSNIPDANLNYSLIVNNEVIKAELTHTLISENENIIEFNVPSTDYSIPSDKLNLGINTIQIKGKHSSSSLSYLSNEITLDHKKPDYLAAR